MFLCLKISAQFKMTSKDALAIGTNFKPPVIFKGEYEQWKDRFLDFIDRHENGEYIKQSIDEGMMKSVIIVVPDEDNENVGSVGKDDDGIKDWQPDINNYEEFKAKAGESLEETYERFVSLLNELAKNKVKKKQIENNVKFLSVLQPEWNKPTRRMKQMKDLSEIPLHEVYETLRQNEEEVEEERYEKKKSEKKVEDLVALVVDRKREKDKKKKKKKKKVVVSSSGSSDSGNLDSDDGENLKQAMILLTRAFQKKFYKNPGFNSQRYSSGSRNFEHKERVEGRRIDDRRSEGKSFVDRKTEVRKYVNEYGEKKAEEPVKCYNCGKISHFSKDCRKPIARNYEY
ncbi:hypothetical protein L6452_15294 [Arctium lappa]|uniref:Uncharacterized protein n=1 Tax=Arctium lappa TaxID=4217 RepID=A0ACB9CND1_ARCLA|nr:hypothetical protein L6452_15294 [Arctium lappa]